MIDFKTGIWNKYTTFATTNIDKSTYLFMRLFKMKYIGKKASAEEWKVIAREHMRKYLTGFFSTI